MDTTWRFFSDLRKRPKRLRSGIRVRLSTTPSFDQLSFRASLWFRRSKKPMAYLKAGR